MRYLSVCSGIEAASVAWEPLGWSPVGFSEIEKFPSRVLSHRFGSNMPGEEPSQNGVPNFGDFTTIPLGTLGTVDLLVGGTPCQAFSVAGKRLSLADARGNLSLAYAVLAHELAGSHGLRWAVWENVPGVLTTDDNAFGCLLGQLVGADDALLPCEKPRAGRSNDLWRWRQSDKTKVWSHVASWPDAGMVAGPRARAAWRVLDAQYFGLAQRRRRVFVVVGFGDESDPAAVLFEPQGLRRNPPTRGEAGEGATLGTLGSSGGSDKNDARDGRLIVHIPSVSATLTARSSRGGGHAAACIPLPGGRARAEAIPILESGKRTGASSTSLKAGDGIGSSGDPMYTLGADSRHAVAFGIRSDADREGTAKTPSADASGIVRLRDPGLGISEELAPTLDSGRPHSVATAWAVRRLTPTECHRLQGFPDDHCAIPGAADGPIYKALGNSMAVSVMRWIGERIQKQESIS